MQKSNFKKNKKKNQNQNNYYTNNYTQKGAKSHKQNNRYNPHDQYVYKKKKKPETIEKYVYKQELIQLGLKIARNPEINNQVLDMIGMYPECFETKKRNVMFIVIEDKEKIEREENIEEIKKDFRNLCDNEEIPDWFLDGANENSSFNFNFGDAVEKTKEFQKEIALKNDLPQLGVKFVSQNDNNNILDSIKNISENNNFVEIDPNNFEALDKLLEKKAKNSFFYEETGSNKKNLIPFSIKKDKDSNEENSFNNSNEFFFNLEDKIKNMLDSDTSSDKFEDSNEESFTEELGFNYSTQRNPKLTPFNPPLEQKNTQTETTITTTVHNTHINKINIYNNVLPPSQEKTQKTKQEEEKKKKISIQIEEKLKISEEEREKKKKYFIEKYGYLDPILCQIVYETLNSKKRKMINKFSLNGFNQKSVEKYCQNNYKIFSMYLQGNIISKVWNYKDKLGNVNGPFMSYDMDVWNGEGDYFSEELLVSLHSSDFLPIQLYIDRDPMVVEIVESFVLKSQKNPELLSNGYVSDKKFKFRKKNQRENRKENFDREKLKDNFEDNFPALGDPEGGNQGFQPRRKKNYNKKNKNGLIDQLSQKPKKMGNNQKGYKNRKNQKYDKKRNYNNRFDNENDQYQKKVEKKIEKKVEKKIEKKEVKKIEKKEVKKIEQKKQEKKIEKKEVKIEQKKQEKKPEKVLKQKPNVNLRQYGKKLEKKSENKNHQINKVKNNYNKKYSKKKNVNTDYNEELTTNLNNLLGLGN